MHRRSRYRRRTLAALGFLASVVALAALLTGGIVESSTPRSDVAGARAEPKTQTETEDSAQKDAPSLGESLKEAAEAQVRAEAKAEAERKARAEAKAEAERKARAEAKAEAEAEAERKAEARREAEAQREAEAERRAAAEREEAAEAAARSAERAESDPRAVARELMADYGWGEEQFSCLDQLWTRESNWDYTAENPTSGAYGIPQSLPPEKMAEFGEDYRTNPITQIEWGLSYIDDTYGTPCSAWSHSEATNWY
ncbi:hypothetical protein CLV30_1279 [Haloactinopolyspora alba]|uniref:Transglycosylase-like protein with SLT domain n=1 Tax=Haloactinopolyspora alba TaxID=648780 RepID=A0A2P8DFS4_9ACTN|nr:hypothetical protein [Haloactinopolyspora alba]PSK96068.1 hypothetical protein CLV30_1279 [Haloactinopolyspora alba]